MVKRILIGIALLGLLSATALAEPGQKGDGKGRHGGGGRMAHMQENLGLSDEQVARMREIRQNGGSRQEMRDVMTDEQRILWDEHRKQFQGRQRGGQGRGMPPAAENPPADPDNG